MYQTIAKISDSLMMEHNIGCLPVVNNEKLVGLITEANFLNITASLLKRLKRKKLKPLTDSLEKVEKNSTTKSSINKAKKTKK